MLLSIFILLLITFGGLALTYVYENKAPLLVRFAAGSVIGCALFSLVAFVAACFFGFSAATVSLALAATLPRYKFVGKAELFRVPLFGRAARAVGSIPIERGNRKAAFQSYDEAAEQIRGGASVVVFAEGTRGTEYALRQFKKGPVILAISAGVPLVPVLVYGTIEILPRGSFRVRPGTVHLHFLEPVDPSGFTYEQRDSLSRIARDRMTEALERLYGIASPPSLPTAERAAAS